MKKRKYLELVGDFETTVYEGQTETEVWSSAICLLGCDNPNDVQLFGSIDDTYKYLRKLSRTINLRVFYHNLKFDGTFWLNYLLQKGFKQGFYKLGGGRYKRKEDDELLTNEFNYLVSEQGVFYEICICTGHKLIKLVDSFKLLPFSVRDIGIAFKTKHQKTSIEYEGKRYAGCYITEDEKAYIKNDVLVISEALYKMRVEEGHNRGTIGGCCMNEFKRTDTYGYEFNELFPDLTGIECPDYLGQYKNAEAFIRQSYKGGWCYVNPNAANKIIKGGHTYDVNSLYPFVMHSSSGSVYPVGKPQFFKGDVPEKAEDKYYIISLKTRFVIKENYLPTVQIKNSLLYNKREWLMTSDVYNKQEKRYQRYLVDSFNKLIEVKPTLILTCTDYELLKKHYYLFDTEILGGCWFETAPYPLFDEYINKHMQEKMTSKGAKKTIAKLFLNNLYGKFATSDDSSFKMCYLDENEILKWDLIYENNKDVVYIPIGTAITSYARNYTITTAQNNYNNFLYSDTDSIHLIGDAPKGIKIDANKLGYWKCESGWSEGIFVRQKTYIEHVIEENGEKIDTPYYNIKCAGMGKHCKELLNASLTQNYTEDDLNKLDPREQAFVKKQLSLTDFKTGLIVPSNLKARTIKGGIVLLKQEFEMKK